MYRPTMPEMRGISEVIYGLGLLNREGSQRERADDASTTTRVCALRFCDELTNFIFLTTLKSVRGLHYIEQSRKITRVLFNSRRVKNFKKYSYVRCQRICICKRVYKPVTSIFEVSSLSGRIY